MISWLFAIVFVIIGLLNVFLVHPVPGFFYLLLSLLYFPQTNAVLKKTVHFEVPLLGKIIFALVILWGTLAVTDLAELLGL